MASEKDEVRRDRRCLVEALKDAGAVVKADRTVKCPFHDDRSPSGSIHKDDQGVWRFTCHGCGWGGDVFDVVEKSGGRKAEDVLRDIKREEMREADEPRPQRKRHFPSVGAIEAATPGHQATYAYTNPDTRRVEMVVVRHLRPDGKKSFKQFQPDGDGFTDGAPPKPWPLYNRTRVRGAHTVVVCEGEKAVHALTDVLPEGYAATTAPCGAGKAEHADWTPLAGKKVILWPDNDAPDPSKGNVRQGIRHMEQVASSLERVEPRPEVLWISPDELAIPPKGDAVEYLQMYGENDRAKERDAVLCAFRIASPVSASRGLYRHLQDIITGKRRSIPWKSHAITKLAKPCLPGTITLICGDPGSTKSYLLLEQMWLWHKEGIHVALYELEEDQEYHLNRALAQVDGNARLDDPDWVFEHPHQSMDAYERHKAFMDSFALRVFAAPGDREKPQITQDDLVAWARGQAEKGARIIAVDPVTMAAPGKGQDRSYTPDLKFLVEMKLVAREFGCSIILVTHPKESANAKGKAFIDNLAGGKAYSRFAQTILWVIKMEEPEHHRMLVIRPGRAAADDPDEEIYDEVERTVRFVKTRNGKGAGRQLGFEFDHRTLTFVEKGLVLKGASRPQFEDHAKPRLDAFGDAIAPGVSARATGREGDARRPDRRPFPVPAPIAGPSFDEFFGFGDERGDDDGVNDYPEVLN